MKKKVESSAPYIALLIVCILFILYVMYVNLPKDEEEDLDEEEYSLVVLESSISEKMNTYTETMGDLDVEALSVEVDGVKYVGANLCQEHYAPFIQAENGDIICRGTGEAVDLSKVTDEGCGPYGLIVAEGDVTLSGEDIENMYAVFYSAYENVVNINMATLKDGISTYYTYCHGVFLEFFTYDGEIYLNKCAECGETFTFNEDSLTCMERVPLDDLKRTEGHRPTAVEYTVTDEIAVISNDERHRLAGVI